MRRRGRNCILIYLALLLILICAAPLERHLYGQAEEGKDSSAVGEAIKSLLGLNQPKIGVLMQFEGKVTDDGIERRDYFEIHNMRLLLIGSVAERFDYFVQGDLRTPFKLLDMKISYRLSDHLRADMGQFKSPFGWEYLREDGRLTFVDRSAAAAGIGTFRQRGAQLACSLLEQRLAAVAGVFDGSGIEYSDSKISLFAGRMSVFPFGASRESDQLKLEVGGSFAFTNDRYDLLQIDPYYQIGHKKLYSAVLRADFMRTWLGGEFNIFGEDKYKILEGARLDLVTAAVRDMELCLRFDYYMSYWPMTPGPASRRQCIAGANWYPDKEVKIQLNLGRDFSGKVNTGILNVQYGVNLPN